MKRSETFCILPWNHIATTSTGNFRVCCNSTPGENYILKEDGSSYNISKDEISEVWNSQTYTTIRKQMLDGERPNMCKRCFREEDSGISSSRNAWNSKWDTENKEFNTTANLEDIKYVDIRLSNLCNLKCRMCNPYSSSQWLDEWNMVAKDKLTESIVIKLSKMDWPEEDKVWETLELLSDSIEEIYLTGGEPTIIKSQHKLLDYLINAGKSSNITLKYNTNLTNIPKHLLESWKLFKSVKLNCSIDAIGELNRYIRYPSDWATIERNFFKVRELPNVITEVHCTVQMYNIFHLHQVLDWANSNRVKVYLNILDHPDHLNIRVLTDEMKIRVENNLIKYYDMPKVKGVVDYMMEDDWSHLYAEFIRYTQILDESRNESLEALVPELCIT